ncbi:MAG: alginate O-acetyltransferase AlgX-related protein [Myxococcota bacterium]
MKGHRIGQVLRVALALIVGVAILEIVFRWRDNGAFPHLNVYQADAALGVRLRPLASARVAFGGSGTTLVATNSAGFRSREPGAEPVPREGEVLFVGDSQAFGLGVDFEQTFASRFGELSKRPVYNAGVPTWGPPEFLAAIDELGKRRHPRTIVYVVNFANDPFEANRPNRERHVAWDGWAVRKELAPNRVTWFPGRELLFRSSHLVFAWRKWWHRLGPAQLDERGTPSEGTFADLLDLGRTQASQRAAERAELERQSGQYEAHTTYAEESYRNAEARVRALVWEELKLGAGSEQPGSAGSVYLAADANPGDIVTPGYGEEGRPVFATAEYIRQAVELRNKFEATLRERAEKVMQSERAKEVLAALSTRDAERLKLQVVREQPLEVVRQASPLARAVLEAKRHSDALGAQFVLLVLPLDVMVSDAEWRKHGARRVDLQPARVLVQDLIESARRASVIAVDAGEALKQAEPGAFLPGDIHLTPKGHSAVARALHTALNDATHRRESAFTGLELPKGRSRVPPPETWKALAGEIAVMNSGRCPITKKYREWLYVSCFPKSERDPSGLGLQVLSEQADAITSLIDGRMILVAPIPRGERLEVLFSWSDGLSKRLIVDWDARGAAPDLRMELEKTRTARAPDHPDLMKALCNCHQNERQRANCHDLIAQPDPDCFRSYSGQCKELLACAEGNPLFPPRCLAGSFNAGATSRCVKGERPARSQTSAEAAASSRAELADEPNVKSAGRELITRAQAFVGERCVLGRDEVEIISVIPFDKCPIDAEMVAAYEKALEGFRVAIRGKASSPAARTFAEKADWFEHWVKLALASGSTRGTAALYQDLALAFNAWQPDQRVFVDSPRMIKLYFGTSGVVGTDYFRNLKHDGAKREAEFIASGRHLIWRRGPNGFEGPFTSFDERVVIGY